MRADPVCPGCGGRCAAPVGTGGGRLRLCRDCGLRTVFPYPDVPADRCRDCTRPCVGEEDCLDTPYERGRFELRLRIEAARLRRLRGLLGRGFDGLRVLEVGSGVGALGALLLEAGADYRGLEPQRAFLRRLRAHVPGLAGRVAPAALEDAGLEDQRFDLVIVADALQFVPRPGEFLGRLRGLLARGGRLYLEVPDEGASLLRGAVRRLLGLYGGASRHPGHLNLFGRRALAAVLARADLEPLAVRGITLFGDPERLQATLRRPLSPGLRALSALVRLLRADLALGLGNLAVLARSREERSS